MKKQAYIFLKNHVQNSIAGVSGNIDKYRLKSILPNYLSSRQKHFSDVLQPTFRDYISQDIETGVAIEQNAASLELMSFVLAFCESFKPKRILDMGCGFSSVAFAYYQQVYPNSVVVSVDDNPQWLEIVKKFIAKVGFSNDNHFKMLWNDFIKLYEHTNFDFILDDFSGIKERQSTLKKVLSMCGGFVVLDDIHKLGYKNYATSILKSSGYRYFSLRKYTLDKYGRYSLLCGKR